MALTVKDILELPSGQRMKLLAGGKGLARPVVSVEIADYEFAPNIQFVPEADFNLQEDMEPGSFIITSFLFAKDDPSLILSSVKTLEKLGMAGLAFKQIIYSDLPEEVITFAEKNNFPLFAFSKDLWFENIIFDIMYAVQFDDKIYLSEEKIDNMLSGKMNRSELDIILKGISLKLRRYISVTYISGKALDAGRTLRSFYMLKGFHSKGLMVRYEDGLFLITTSDRGDMKTHDLIRKEAFELLGIGMSVDENPEDSTAILTGTSDIHEPSQLDKAFRESRYCFTASSIEGRTFTHFSASGVYRVLLPAIEHEESAAFAADIFSSFDKSADLRETVKEYLASGGDVTKTSAVLHCHQNTVRYRLGKIRELTGLTAASDSELFMQLKIASVISNAKGGRHL